MSDDIVTRLRAKASRCTHGNERHYHGPEGIETYFKESCGLCGSWDEAAAEIERLRLELEEQQYWNSVLQEQIKYIV